MVNFETARESVASTPVLVIDRKATLQNLERLHGYARQHSLQVRPHTKTHKTIEFARLQIEYGSCGLTVAKVGEAEVMAKVGDDLLIAYPAIDIARTRRLADLARRVTVRVAVDSEYGIQRLAEAARSAGTTLGILIDLDVGAHRTGVGSPVDCLSLAQQVDRSSPALRLDGLFIYPGHIWKPADQQSRDLAQVSEQVSTALELWDRSALPVSIVSGGSTPTAYQSHQVERLTEIRPGTYLFNDMNTVRAGYCELQDCSAAIVCTVISTAVPGKVIIDAGSKTLTSDRNVLHPDSGYGHTIEYPQARLTKLSEEHGEVEFPDGAQRPQLGQRLTIIPNHICPCVNLQQHIYLQEPSGMLHAIRVDARGLLS